MLYATTSRLFLLLIFSGPLLAATEAPKTDFLEKLQNCYKMHFPDESSRQQYVKEHFQAEDVKEMRKILQSEKYQDWWDAALNTLGSMALMHPSTADAITDLLISYIEATWPRFEKDTNNTRYYLYVMNTYRSLAKASTSKGYDYLKGQAGELIKFPFRNTRQRFAVHTLGLTRRMSCIVILDRLRGSLGPKYAKWGRTGWYGEPGFDKKAYLQLPQDIEGVLVDCWGSMGYWIEQTEKFGVIKDTDQPVLTDAEIQELRDVRRRQRARFQGTF